MISPAKTVLPAPPGAQLVALAAIDVKPQVRTKFDKGGLEDLAESIRANGLLQPVLLRRTKSGRFELIAGERRLRAAKSLGLTHIPAIAGEADGDAKLRMQLAENLDRAELDDSEVGAALDPLVRATSVTEVAAKLKRSKAWVSKRCTLFTGNRTHWRVSRIFDDGKSEDLELLGALNRLCDADYKAGEAMCDLVEKGKATRDQVRDELRKVKAAEKERADAAAAASKGKKKAPAKEPKFRADREARVLFDLAHDGRAYDQKFNPIRQDPAERLAKLEPEQQVKLVSPIQAAYDAGAAAVEAEREAGAKDALEARYRAVFRRFFERDYDDEAKRAAWIAGVFGRHFDVAELLEDVKRIRKGKA